MSFGAVLKQRRIQAGLSQNELARRSGIDPAYANQLEHDTLTRTGKPRQPSRDIVLAIAGALQLSELATDRFLWEAGLAPVEDWMTRAIQAEANLMTIHAVLGVWEVQRGRPDCIERNAGVRCDVGKQTAYGLNTRNDTD